MAKQYQRGDFKIEPILEQFHETVGPQIGSMVAVTNDYITRNTNVASTAAACAGELGGAYKSNNIGKAIKAYTELKEGCGDKIAQAGLKGKVIPILDACQALDDKIVKLMEIQKAAFGLIAERDSCKLPEEEARYWAIDAQIDAKKDGEFDPTQTEALAMLAALQGMDATIEDMNPTNGSLSYEPNINVDAKKGAASLKEQYHSYNMGDTTISSIQS